MGRSRAWSDIDLNNALYEYHNNRDITTEEIYEKYKIPKSSFMRYLDYKEPWRAVNKKREYTFNLNKFKRDSHEKFYWLGFIAADGAIVRNSLTIELKDNDAQHLMNFNTYFENTKMLDKRINNSGCHCIKASINSFELIQYLAEYNIIQNKSLNFVIPVNKIPQVYIYDFVRGLIDGDGTVSINKNNQIFLSFCSGNKQCVEQVANILDINNKISYTSGAYRFSVTGNKKALAILDLIYNESKENIRLERKYNNYITIKNLLL